MLYGDSRISNSHHGGLNNQQNLESSRQGWFQECFENEWMHEMNGKRRRKNKSEVVKEVKKNRGRKDKLLLECIESHAEETVGEKPDNSDSGMVRTSHLLSNPRD